MWSSSWPWSGDDHASVTCEGQYLVTDFLFFFKKESFFFSPYRFCCFRTHKDIQNLSMNDLSAVKPNVSTVHNKSVWHLYIQRVSKKGRNCLQQLIFLCFSYDYALVFTPSYPCFRPPSFFILVPCLVTFLWPLSHLCTVVLGRLRKWAPLPNRSTLTSALILQSFHHHIIASQSLIGVFRFHLESSHALYLQEKQKHTKRIHTGSLFFLWQTNM